MLVRARIGRGTNTTQFALQRCGIDDHAKSSGLTHHPLKAHLGQSRLSGWVAASHIRMNPGEPDILHVLPDGVRSHQILAEAGAPFINRDGMSNVRHFGIVRRVGKRPILVDDAHGTDGVPHPDKVDRAGAGQRLLELGT